MKVSKLLFLTFINRNVLIGRWVVADLFDRSLALVLDMGIDFSFAARSGVFFAERDVGLVLWRPAHDTLLETGFAATSTLGLTG